MTAITQNDIYSFVVHGCDGGVGTGRKCMHRVEITRIDGKKYSFGTMLRADIQAIMNNLVPVKIKCHSGTWHFCDKVGDGPFPEIQDVLNKIFKHDPKIDRLMTLTEEELKHVEMTDDERKELALKKANALFREVVAIGDFTGMQIVEDFIKNELVPRTATYTGGAEKA